MILVAALGCNPYAARGATLLRTPQNGTSSSPMPGSKS